MSGGRTFTLAVRVLLALLILGAAHAAAAQTARTFKARLSVVPIDVAMQQTIAGGGSVTATLEGSKLTINGTFKDLKSPATVARLHRGYRGVRGPSFADLTVTHDTSGAITGSVELTPSQVTELTKSSIYLQLHSEKAPDGNLWGWLLPAEGRK